MSLTLVLAKILGIYFTVFGISILKNKEHFDNIMTALTKNHAIQLIASILPVLVGSTIVVIHNQWVGWPITVTFVGWFILLSGIFRAIFPDIWVERIKKSKHGRCCYLIVFLVIGIYLLGYGFHEYIKLI